LRLPFAFHYEICAQLRLELRIPFQLNMQWLYVQQSAEKAEKEEVRNESDTNIVVSTRG